MAIICNSYIKTEDLAWHKDTNTFVTMASNLGRNHPSRIFDDACDEGYVVISERTQRRVIFALSQTQRDAEGDVICWDFDAVRTPDVKDIWETIRDIKLRVYND